MKLNKISKISSLFQNQIYKIRHKFSTGPSFVVLNPLTSKPAIQYPHSDLQSDMQKSILQISQHRVSWNKLQAIQKKSHILKFISSFQQSQQPLIKILQECTGKTQKQAKQQFQQGLQMIKYDLAQDYTRVVEKGENCGKYYLQPFQNVLVVFDHCSPILSALKYLVLSMIAGNGIIMKPDRYALPIAKNIESIWKKAVSEYPIVYCPVNLFSDGLQYLVQHQQTGFVSFSGDIAQGNNFYHFMAMNSEIFAQSQFLLSSNDAAYVTKNLTEQSLNECVSQLVKGCFTGAGALFNSIKRIFVDKQIQQKFIRKFLEAAKQYEIDRQNSQMSAIITSKHTKMALSHIQELQSYKNQDLKLLNAIKYKKGQKYMHISPIIYKVQGIPDLTYWTKIYPIPICFIQSVSSSSSCIEKINQSIYGISASIFTNIESDVQKIGSQLEVGTIYANRWGFSHGVPYAARKRSGKGFSFSKFSFTNIVRSKSVSL